MKKYTSSGYDSLSKQKQNWIFAADLPRGVHAHGQIRFGLRNLGTRITTPDQVLLRVPPFSGM